MLYEEAHGDRRDLHAPARWSPMNGDATPLSVVLPVLNEQDNLEPLHARLVDALEPMAREYEVIYVDDGSTTGPGKQSGRSLRATGESRFCASRGTSARPRRLPAA